IGGDSSGDGDFNDLTGTISSWEICEVIDPDDVAEKMAYTSYNMGPVSQPLGSATSPNALTCQAGVEIPAGDDHATGGYELSVAPGEDADKVVERYEAQIQYWHDGNDLLQEGEEGWDDSLVYMDEAVEGPWNEGHVLAMQSFGSSSGSVMVAMRAENYAVWVYLHIPPDPGIYFGESIGLEGEELEARREMPFIETEIAQWAVEEYAPQVFDTVTTALESE
ncbi:hypothetical protein, partial [Glycomyces buryatensis]|uniref:hypothetical protein n=1 Tax=Glycomyces buryatensis TaxID=2570927 RepID=UPI00145627EE